MTLPRYAAIVMGFLGALALSGVTLAQTATAKCGPDHAILYKRAVGLLDQAEKKLTARYTAEAKSMVKEANSLFTILQKECGADQKDRILTDKEAQQEAINQKLAADEQSAAERLMQSAADKEKKAQQLEAAQPDVSKKYQGEAKQEYELAHKRYIKAGIYALRNQQMIFGWLGK
jgi:DNA anti-recombination protein RmuC